jgi:RNA polymerase sigma-70 factor (ECF subfamily)
MEVLALAYPTTSPLDVRAWRAGSRAKSDGVTSAARAPVDEAMERYARGDDASFAAVYDALAPRLYGYLLRQTRDAARAEDLVQQTLLHMHRARSRFIPGAEVTPWAFAIARRLLIDGIRRGRREVLSSHDDSPQDDAPSNDASADSLVEAQETADRIQRVLLDLPAAQRVAFELVKQEGLSLAEAAQTLGTTVAAVKLRAHRAYEALRAVLGDVLESGGGR